MKRTIKYGGETATIIENENMKVCSSANYRYVFNKKTGYFMRWGKTFDDDPQYSPFGPELLDVEISTGSCDGNCRWCLPIGTRISTLGGEKHIEDIQVGDLVVGFNESPKVQEVKEIYVREYDDELIDIELENGRILSLTPNHEVYVQGRGFVEASKLNVDDEIQYF